MRSWTRATALTPGAGSTPSKRRLRSPKSVGACSVDSWSGSAERRTVAAYDWVLTWVGQTLVTAIPTRPDARVSVARPSRTTTLRQAPVTQRGQERRLGRAKRTPPDDSRDSSDVAGVTGPD